MDLLSSLGGSVGRFFTWWFGELAGLIPGALRSGMRSSTRYLALEFADRELILTSYSGGRTREVGRIDLPDETDAKLMRVAARRGKKAVRGGEEIVVRLPQGQAMRTSLELPQVAEPDLRQALAFQIDRVTPFSAEEVYFDYWIRSREHDTKRLNVELYAAPRSVVEDAVARAERLGFQPTVVDVAPGEGDQNPRINLLQAANGGRKRGGWSLLNATLAAIALALIAVLIYLPLEQRRLTADALSSRLATAQLEADQALRLQEEIESLRRDNRFLLERKQAAASVTHIVDELTKLFPDGTWVSEFRMTEREINVVGYSPAASSLVGLIDASPLFARPRFRSPITQDARSGLERFNISFELEQGGTA